MKKPHQVLKTKITISKRKLAYIVFGFLAIITSITTTAFVLVLTNANKELAEDIDEIKASKVSVEEELMKLKNEDQFLRNEKLQEEITNIHDKYRGVVEAYEKILKMKDDYSHYSGYEVDKLLSEALINLADQNYEEASERLTDLNNKLDEDRKKIEEELAKKAAVVVATASSEPPGSGYRRQSVATTVGTFTVDIVAADLGSTKVIVDTASGGDCHNNCPTLSLGEYVSRNNAYAGVNGSYFCPASYPSCAGKTNSFDTLLMNKDKVYFNSGNNVYSTVPAVIFGGGWIRFVGQSLDWGRDTGIDSMIANQPMLVQGGNISFGGDSDPKKGSRAGRSFVANKGNTVYIGVVFGATVAESAHALHTLGMENALNLDSGGSTALWSGGYKAGPGRNIPNAVLFVRK